MEKGKWVKGREILDKIDEIKKKRDVIIHAQYILNRQGKMVIDVSRFLTPDEEEDTGYNTDGRQFTVEVYVARVILDNIMVDLNEQYIRLEKEFSEI
jgi:hypothetical protein